MMAKKRDKRDNAGRHRYIERRKKADWVTKSIPVLSVLGWAGAFITLLFLERAKPGRSDFFVRFMGAPLKNYWNSSLLWTALIILLVVLVICLIGFTFNVLRSRRKTDKYRMSIIILGILTLCGIVVLLCQFSIYF